MQRFLVWLLILAVPVIGFLYLSDGDISAWRHLFSQEQPVVTIDDVPIRIEIADTAAERTQGLSGRSELGSTSGLLFVFDTSGFHGIWMKDMNFAIDVIWINDRFEIVDIEPNLKPETYPKIFEPRVPARFVLETNANYAESFGIKIGERINIPEEHIPADLRIE